MVDAHAAYLSRPAPYLKLNIILIVCDITQTNDASDANMRPKVSEPEPDPFAKTIIIKSKIWVLFPRFPLITFNDISV